MRVLMCSAGELRADPIGFYARKVAGGKRCHEEATRRTAPTPAEPHGPRRCGWP